MTRLETKKGYGKYWVAEKTYKRGDTIWQGIPLVTAPSQGRFGDACSNCFNSRFPLLLCNSCRRMQYCSNACQKHHWRWIHKLECLHIAKIPRENTVGIVLLVIRSLLLIRAGRGDGILQLETHEKVMNVSSAADAIKYLAAGIRTYLEEKDDNLVKSLFHTVFINAIEYTTVEKPKTGVVLDPFIARLNHSCDPNTFITYHGPQAMIRAFKDIKIGEVITLTYVDPKMAFKTRQAALKNQYHFECKCSRCRTFPRLCTTLDLMSDLYYCCMAPVYPNKDGDHQCDICKCDYKWRFEALKKQGEEMLAQDTICPIELAGLIERMSKTGMFNLQSDPMALLYRNAFWRAKTEVNFIEEQSRRYTLAVLCMSSSPSELPGALHVQSAALVELFDILEDDPMWPKGSGLELKRSDLIILAHDIVQQLRTEMPIQFGPAITWSEIDSLSVYNVRSVGERLSLALNPPWMKQLLEGPRDIQKAAFQRIRSIIQEYLNSPALPDPADLN